MTTLIGPGVPASAGTWAELGAGSGNFTLALAELLPPGSTIYAVDRVGWGLRRLEMLGGRTGGSVIHTLVADITRPLNLPPLDGILLANVLHWIEPQADVLGRCRDLLVPNGVLLVVEYDTERALPWVPLPVPFRRLATLAHAAGFTTPTWLGVRHSPTHNPSMYAAQCRAAQS